MASVYEIVQGLAQAASHAYDGALTEDGELVKVGLRREEGHPIHDKRVIDGFNVRFSGNKMVLSYQSEVHLKEVHASGFENEIDQRLTDIVSFLKKECRKVTGSTVTLKEEGEVDMRVESASRIRSWVTATKTFVIESIDAESILLPSENALEPTWKAFLEQGGWNGGGGKRPENDDRKKDKGPKS